MNLKLVLLKTLTWKLVSSAIFFVLLLIFTGSVTVAGELAAIDFVLKAVAYYLHEIAWLKGTKKGDVEVFKSDV